MAAASSSSHETSLLSRAGISRRAVASAWKKPASVRGSLNPDIDPPPKPWRVAQYLALAFILFLAMLQFRPPTHFRDPSDPFGTWIPHNSNFDLSSPTVTEGNLSSSNEGESNIISTGNAEPGMVHIVSWMDCLDLRMLAVLVNSTLSNSRYPESIHFHIFTPEGDKDKVSYYKLKVLFPHSNLEFIGQEKVKGKLETATSVGGFVWPSLQEVAPFVIPSTHPFLKRFIYVSPDIIMKERVEELFGVDLSNYAVAAAEDCRILLHEYVNFDILDAIQRSATKPWVSRKPYEKNACVPDLSMLLINSKKLEYDLVEAILWWSKVLAMGNERFNQTNPAFVLALYDKSLKLSTAWKVRDRIPSKTNCESNLLRFDGARKACSSELNTRELGFGDVWKQYLSTPSDRILIS
ncbi:hypothetical protein MRB53_018733 [Persea americana]|uniref:Uncharacterized protein n=1 Tax=Persea americana TaxID=3435 RepID=A0ACC2M8L1_PERAE|nr:hypothetical protein MRB53_018733 [Persea americana]|eukprot:TRINITY_DN25325_c0_g2_i1.p1 TRINITY_DN25325_c0_g2~~TRINITY_DN25325_c0_g2_i1.p1  ORF type:complete len:408 (-),score=81.78 TRINITY_DN25325_c0_g2_i1:277-1500(-)